jgi:hypothetical protein
MANPLRVLPASSPSFPGETILDAMNIMMQRGDKWVAQSLGTTPAHCAEGPAGPVACGTLCASVSQRWLYGTRLWPSQANCTPTPRLLRDSRISAASHQWVIIRQCHGLRPCPCCQNPNQARSRAKLNNRFAPQHFWMCCQVGAKR